MAEATSRTTTDKSKLESARQELCLEVEHLKAELRSLAEPTADEADADAFEREKIWALLTSLQRKIDSIEHAMQLAETGAYGRCQKCQEEIDPARLEILPHATLCLRCQREFERQSRRARP